MSTIKQDPICKAEVALPNFIYVGTSKAGSTWIYNLLNSHPDIFMASGKGLYFFDGHYDRGAEWYLDHFTSSSDSAIRGEVSHSYLSSDVAPCRMAELNPNLKIMACLREPIDRAFSAYLHGLRNETYPVGMSFLEAVDSDEDLVTRGRYAAHLQNYLRFFGREQMHLALFDDLQTEPRQFATSLLSFLEVDEIDLPPELLKKMMPAGTPRSRPLVRCAKAVSRWIRKSGLRSLHGRMKTSRALRSTLYRPFADDKPTVSSDERANLAEKFRDDVHNLSEIVGVDMVNRWGYLGD